MKTINQLFDEYDDALRNVEAERSGPDRDYFYAAREVAIERRNVLVAEFDRLKKELLDLQSEFSRKLLEMDEHWSSKRLDP